jgi:peptide chain release factor 1
MEISSTSYSISRDDIKVRTTKDSGAGEHRNKTESCVVMKHEPTGITVKAAKKSQHQNRKNAKKELEVRVQHWHQKNEKIAEDETRRIQVGSGMRGDKVRTYRERDDIVINHISNGKARYSDILSGRLEKIWQS